MKAHQKTIGTTDSWITPIDIIKALGDFDLDPCTPEYMPYEIAKKRYTEKDDGLTKEWIGRVWLNPPFNRKERSKWMQRMSKHKNGIMLIPAACETKAFYEYVWDGGCTGILMMKGRPHFHYPDGTRAKANSGCTICLVAYDEFNLQMLIKSNLGVVLKPIN